MSLKMFPWTSFSIIYVVIYSHELVHITATTKVGHSILMDPKFIYITNYLRFQRLISNLDIRLDVLHMIFFKELWN